MGRKIYLDYLNEELNSSLVFDDDAELGVIIEVTKNDGSSRRDLFKTSRKILETLSDVFTFLLFSDEIQSFNFHIVNIKERIKSQNNYD